uniref:RFX-type winged-helix domain-containing protein n=1 Tax=Strigamia maritima TaxID=126957 RepID=T1JBP4_STRMM
MTSLNTINMTNEEAWLLNKISIWLRLICVDDMEAQGEPKLVNKPLRPHSTPATLMWLEENYEIADGICIPRSTLYMHYVDFCDRNGMQPVNAASFGKSFTNHFNNFKFTIVIVISTCDWIYICSSAGDVKKEIIRQTSPYSPKSKLATLLPEFPNARSLHLPSSVAEEKVATFVMMYRTHCQRVMDTVIRASFDEVESFLLHFWQGMPSHIMSVLGTNVIVNIIGVCDSILYRAISNVLLPTVLQPLPDSLTQVIRKFSKDLESWIKVAMEDLPENLATVKIDLARIFSQTLRRQTSLNHLCQASRMVLHNPDITTQMLQDWRNIDQDSICRQTIYTMDKTYNCVSLEFITNLYREFEILLEEQSSIEAYADWLETMVDRCVVKPGRRHKTSIRRLSRQFLLMWSSFGTRVIRDMTLHSAPSFGSFHLLHLTFDDYVLYLVETLHSEERMRELYANITTDTPPSFSDSDETFGDPDGNLNKIKWYNPPGSNSSEAISQMVLTPTIPSSRPNNEVIAAAEISPQNSATDSSNTQRENCMMNEDSSENATHIMNEYQAGSEPYNSMYPYGGFDSRNGYRGNSRTYSYPSNQYIMTTHNTESNPADVSTSTREINVRNVEATTGLEYTNTYLSYRRTEYTNYPYEANTASVIYPSSQENSYYQAYENSTCYNGRSYKLKDDARDAKERMDEGVECDVEKPVENPVIIQYNLNGTYVRV